VLEQLIAETPARTLAGIAAQLRFPIRYTRHDGPEDDLPLTRAIELKAQQSALATIDQLDGRAAVVAPLPAGAARARARRRLADAATTADINFFRTARVYMRATAEWNEAPREQPQRETVRLARPAR
jgi:hypothetical protein